MEVGETTEMFTKPTQKVAEDQLTRTVGKGVAVDPSTR
jgi:hypothetical protein